jgi:hypothetical protein
LPPKRGGTSWRITGPDYDGDPLRVGMETYEDHLGKKVLLVTVLADD